MKGIKGNFPIVDSGGKSTKELPPKIFLMREATLELLGRIEHACENRDAKIRVQKSWDGRVGRTKRKSYKVKRGLTDSQISARAILNAMYKAMRSDLARRNGQSNQKTTKSAQIGPPKKPAKKKKRTVHLRRGHLRFDETDSHSSPRAIINARLFAQHREAKTAHFIEWMKPTP
jgi:hypothetical protein